MGELMDCEKLIHGDRECKPFPKFFKLDDKGKKQPVKETNYPYRCQRYALRYKVLGSSFTTFAVLCTIHAKAARKEGFRLEESPES